MGRKRERVARCSCGCMVSVSIDDAIDGIARADRLIGEAVRDHRMVCQGTIRLTTEAVS